MRLIHRPTGVEISGEIPSGHYSRNEMRRLRDELIAHLWTQLEREVAQHLRIPVGRVLVLGAFLSWEMGERCSFSNYAVARESGHLVLHLRPCTGASLSIVSIGEGTSPSARPVVTLAANGTGGARSWSLDVDDAPGVTRTGPDFAPGKTYVITRVEDAGGGNLVSTVLTFRPDKLHEGEAVSNDHGKTSTGPWLAKSSDCSSG